MDTSRKGILRTLRLGEAGSGDSERSEATHGHPFICVPGVIAGEIDALPAERRDMLKQRRIKGMRFRHYFYGPFEINRIPESDGRDKQIQTAGPVPLVLERAVPD